MDLKRFLITLAAAFAFVFVFDFVVHGFILSDTYMQTPHLWRGEADHIMSVMMLSQLLFCTVLTYIYCKEFTEKGVAAGVRFGLHVGLILAALDIGKYSYLPISCSLALSWAVASIVGAIGVCVVIAVVHEKA